MKYIFKSERLGFRNWHKNDLTEFAKMNADPDVMEHFPQTLDSKDTDALITRLKNQYELRGYTYFATDILETGEFIGFIGIVFQEYTTKFTPATDIGWRLKKSAWGNGYATEGAKRSLEYAFKHLQLKSVIAVCTAQNSKSENVMQKIGMKNKGTFLHPKLKAFPAYEKCICYEITNEDFLQNSKL